MVHIEMSNPKNRHHPVGPYSQVSRVRASELVFLAGQTATDMQGKLVGPGDFEAQCKQVFANVEAALSSVGASWSNVVHFTNYLINRDDQPKFVQYRLRFFSTTFPHCYPPDNILFLEKLPHKEVLV